MMVLAEGPAEPEIFDEAIYCWQLTDFNQSEMLVESVLHIMVKSSALVKSLKKRLNK